MPARHCWGNLPQVWEGTGPTVLDALVDIIDALAQRGILNPTICGSYVWDDPEPSDERTVIVTVEN